MTTQKQGQPVVVGDLTLVPIVEVSISEIRVAGQSVFTGSKRPVAIIVRSAVDEWRIEVPGPGAGA
jgi:hypothetical protein